MKSMPYTIKNQNYKCFMAQFPIGNYTCNFGIGTFKVIDENGTLVVNLPINYNEEYLSDFYQGEDYNIDVLEYDENPIWENNYVNVNNIELRSCKIEGTNLVFDDVSGQKYTYDLENVNNHNIRINKINNTIGIYVKEAA